MSSSGNDANDGSAAHPWATLGAALGRLQAGATLEVRGGTYREQITSVSIHPGTASAPVTVQAYPGERPVVEGLLWVSGASYWTFDGINVTWDPAITDTSLHMVKMTNGVGWSFRNAELWGAHSYAALLIASTTAGEPAGWSVTGNCIHDTYTSNSTNQDHLIYVNSGLSTAGGVIERNLLFGAPNGEGVKLGGPTSASGSGNVTVRYNTIYNASQDILVAWQSHDNAIYRNLLDKVDLTLSPAYGNIRGYQLSGTGNVAHDDLGYDAHALIFNDSGYTGVADGGGNQFPTDPAFDSLTCAGFHPTNSAATAFGRYA